MEPFILAKNVFWGNRTVYTQNNVHPNTQGRAMTEMEKMAQHAQEASYLLAQASTTQKNDLLSALAQGLRELQQAVQRQNSHG